MEIKKKHPTGLHENIKEVELLEHESTVAGPENELHALFFIRTSNFFLRLDVLI